MSDFNQFGLLKTSLSALKRLNISRPTPIQSLSIPHLMEGRDVIAQACTGSGKTLAFGLPLMGYIDPKKRQVQAVVLVPTRELATQVVQVLDELGRDEGIRCALLVGGKSLGPQESCLRQGAQIAVGAPGRVLDLIGRGSLKLDAVAYFVLDEADEMLDRGFMPDVKKILAAAPPPKRRITALFSATQPEWVEKTAALHMHQPIQVKVEPKPEERPKIEHLAQEIEEGGRMAMLRQLLGERDGSTIVFARTKHGVKKLARQLVALDYPAGALQGNMSQNARDRVVEQFRKGDVEIMVATNVAARGLDLEGVTQVINYELPETAELLTHRVGRTGRMGKSGTAITLIAPSDQPKWRELQRALGHSVARRGVPAIAPKTSRVGLSPSESRPRSGGGGSRSVRPSQPARGR